MPLPLIQQPLSLHFNWYILGQLNDHYLRGEIWDPYVIKDAQITSKYSNMSHLDQTTNNIQN